MAGIAIDVTELKLLAALLAGAKLVYSPKKEWVFYPSGVEEAVIGGLLANVAFRCLEKGYFTRYKELDYFEVSDEAKKLLTHMEIDSIFTTL